MVSAPQQLMVWTSLSSQTVPFGLSFLGLEENDMMREIQTVQNYIWNSWTLHWPFCMLPKKINFIPYMVMISNHNDDQGHWGRGSIRQIWHKEFFEHQMIILEKKHTYIGCTMYSTCHFTTLKISWIQQLHLPDWCIWKGESIFHIGQMSGLHFSSPRQLVYQQKKRTESRIEN